MRIGTIYRYELLRRLGIFREINKEKEVLDVGGFDGFILSKLKARKKVLIDPDAKKVFKKIIYLKEDFFKHDFNKKKFDFILSLDVLEHIPIEKEVLYFLKIKSLLKEGGRAIITTPSKKIRIFPFFLKKWISKKWGHYKCLGYNKEELKDLIKRAKIKKYEIYSYNSKYYLNFYLLIKTLEPILPENLFKKIISFLAKKDAKLNKYESRGYYLIKITK